VRRTTASLLLIAIALFLIAALIAVAPDLRFGPTCRAFLNSPSVYERLNERFSKMDSGSMDSLSDDDPAVKSVIDAARIFFNDGRKRLITLRYSSGLDSDIPLVSWDPRSTKVLLLYKNGVGENWAQDPKVVFGDDRPVTTGPGWTTDYGAILKLDGSREPGYRTRAEVSCSEKECHGLLCLFW
jgi:hypothetical protein